MASQAETVELLVRKAKFEPQVALAVAEAIDNAMTDAKFVTVPILDARLADLRAELRSDISKVENEVVATRESLSKEIAVSNERLVKEIGVTNERTKAELVRWVLLAMLASTAIGISATAITNAIQHAH